jgi:co-chaperonin GroES (HSP10)
MLVPNKGRIIVRPLVEKEYRQNGIVLLNINPHERALQGEVLAISEGSPCEVGSQILFPPFAGDGFRQEENGKWVEYRIIRTDSILAFL